MSPDVGLPETYADLMSIHRMGHAFYHPEHAHNVRPGTCGYINNSGQWQPIVDLTDEAALAAGSFKPLTQLLIKATPDEFAWEDVTSEGVHSNKPSISVGADGSTVGVPAEASVEFSLEKSVSAGAVLLCNSTVHRKGYRHESPFLEWGKANANAIIKNCKDAKRYGFWVVLTTWTCSSVWTNVWKNSQKSVSIGITARSAGIGELSPRIEWSNSQSGGGWVHPTPTMKNGKVDQRVIFFSGVKFKVYKLPFGAVTREVRGTETIIVDDPDDVTKPENERMRYEFEISVEGAAEDKEEMEEEDEEEDEG
ncbi:hypothetical protein BKA64DRAFT_654747 [Cadophora sp. MPI-SDFR-AT-0126]|nr:hypothetical protein BKA64DRAFT_654747 [Leotiomycetes sp. MPI-SDFR-AT-0126]